MAEPEEQTAPPQKSILFPTEKPWLKLAQAALYTVACLILVVGILALIDTTVYANRAYPNTYFAGMPIANKSFSEIQKILQDKIATLEQEGLTYTYENQTWQAAPSELGLTLDYQPWTAEIEYFATDSDPIENTFSKLRLFLYRQEFKPDLKVQNAELYEEFLTALAADVDIPETDASLKIENGEVVITPSQPGKRINRGELIAETNAQLNELRAPRVEVRLQEVQPRVTAADVEPLQEQARTWSQQTVHLRYDLHDWEIKPDELSTWISTAYDPETGNVILTTNSETGVAALQERGKNGFNQPPRDAVFEFNDGKVVRFEPSIDGITIDAQQTLLQLDAALQAGEKTTEIAVMIQEPEVKTEEVNDLGIRERIGRGVSYFNGSSWARMHNIQTAAAKLNGTIVPPHTEFSYNDTLGDVTTATGYVVGLIISQGRTQEGVGGGVCQPSTTMFRAALDAGFPITERYAHAYRVHYYEEGGPGYEHAKPGMDATVYAPSKDLTFLNDTDYSILILTHYEQESYRLTIDLYGTSDGRTVAITEPKVYNVTKAPAPEYYDVPDKPVGYIKQIDWAAGGADTEFSRTVTYPDGTVKEETWTSHYKPWSAKYERGTMVEGEPVPAPTQ